MDGKQCWAKSGGETCHGTYGREEGGKEQLATNPRLAETNPHPTHLSSGSPPPHGAKCGFAELIVNHRYRLMANLRAGRAQVPYRVDRHPGWSSSKEQPRLLET